MKIKLDHIKQGLILEIKGDDETLFEISDEDVIQFGEAKIQLIEGYTYEYQFSDEVTYFKENNKRNAIITHSKFGKHKGQINPNVHVGTHTLEIINSTTLLPIEVRSIKSNYRSEYRYMLECIAEKCTDLIMKIDSPINQHFETDFDKSPETLYQRFSFVKSLINSNEFEEAIQKIVSNPTTKWQEEHEVKDIRRIQKLNQKNSKQLINKSNRIKINNAHFFNKSIGLTSIPAQIDSTKKTESKDTAENRFIKHALEEFLNFCENCELKFEKYSTAKFESGLLATKISIFLNQSFFKQISRPTFLKLNSPVLQRKSGYREVLHAWLKFDLAAKLIWPGGDNVYNAGKKDIASLYEYWIFFTLLDLLKEIFKIEPKSIAELIHYEKGQLSLNLKQGTAIAMKGVFNSPSRNLNIQFSYNRSFGGGKTYPNAGSYTTTLRPDYTLSIWPEEIIDAEEAEIKELITHIHFDAKYKVNNFYELITKSKDKELSEEENIELIKEETEEVINGTFKNHDLLKMHAYKDAIRRTAGAYVLYPGEGKNDPFRGFHELIPGLGAFVIKPNKEDKDKENLKKFIEKVIENLVDRASQREYTAIKVHHIHKDKKDDTNVLNEPMPEYLDYLRNEKLIPHETFVLVGYCKDNSNIKWYEHEGKYNFRMDDNNGSLSLENSVVNAKYLLMRESGKDVANRIYKITSKGPKVYKGTSLVGYKTNDLKDYYLVIEIEKAECNDFNGASFNFNNLEKFKEIKAMYNSFTAAGIPFAVSVADLMKVKVK